MMELIEASAPQISLKTTILYFEDPGAKCRLTHIHSYHLNKEHTVIQAAVKV